MKLKERLTVQKNHELNGTSGSEKSGIKPSGGESTAGVGLAKNEPPDSKMG